MPLTGNKSTILQPKAETNNLFPCEGPDRFWRHYEPVAKSMSCSGSLLHLYCNTTNCV